MRKITLVFINKIEYMDINRHLNCSVNEQKRFNILTLFFNLLTKFDFVIRIRIFSSAVIYINVNIYIYNKKLDKFVNYYVEKQRVVPEGSGMHRF